MARSSIAQRVTRIALMLQCASIVGCPSAPPPQDAFDVSCPDIPATSTATPQTLTYLFASIEVGTSLLTDTTQAGFDLDGLLSLDTDSGGCVHNDFFSILDPDQNCTTRTEQCPGSTLLCGATRPGCSPATSDDCRGGVDNQLPVMLDVLHTLNGEDARSSLDAAISQGRFGILMQVLDVDDLVNDPSVRVRLFKAWAAPGTPCNGIPLDATYQVNRASLRSGGSTLDDAAFVATGAIVNGRLRLAAPADRAFSMAWPTRGPDDSVPFPLDVHQVMLRFDVLALGGLRGNFGGWIVPQTIVEWAMSRNVMMGELNVIRSLLGGIVDLSVNGVCDGSMETPPTLGHISIGFGFTLVRANIDPTNPIVDSPAPGSCATSAHRDGAMD